LSWPRAALLFACWLLITHPAVAGQTVEGFVAPAEQRLCPISKLNITDMRAADLSPLSDDERNQFMAMLNFYQFLLDSGLENYCLVQLSLAAKASPEIFIPKSAYDKIFTVPASASKEGQLAHRIKLTVEELVDGENRVWKGSAIELLWVGRVE